MKLSISSMLNSMKFEVNKLLQGNIRKNGYTIEDRMLIL